LNEYYDLIIDKARYKHKISVISSFRRDIDEICTLLGYDAALSGNPLPTFQGNMSVPSSRVKKFKKSRKPVWDTRGLCRERRGWEQRMTMHPHGRGKGSQTEVVAASLSHAGASSLAVLTHVSPYINPVFPVLAFYSSWTS
jgi:hypothetical protein